MAHTGQEIHGPDGYRLLLVQTAADTGGELLEMEATYGGTGAARPSTSIRARPSGSRCSRAPCGRSSTAPSAVYGKGEGFAVPAGPRTR